MKLIASWDDGSLADLKMAELMARYNIPTIFYWPSMLGEAKNMAFTSSWLNMNQCKEIASRFEIGSHSITHQFMKKMSVPQVANEINDSKKFWQDLTGQEINSFAYPKNSLNSMVKSLVKGAGYKSARTSVPGCLSPGEDSYEICGTVQVGIDRVEYQEKSWELFADEMISKANEESVFHIFGNSWEVEAYDDWNNLENLIKKIIT